MTDAEIHVATQPTRSPRVILNVLQVFSRAISDRDVQVRTLSRLSSGDIARTRLPDAKSASRHYGGDVQTVRSGPMHQIQSSDIRCSGDRSHDTSMARSVWRFSDSESTGDGVHEHACITDVVPGKGWQQWRGDLNGLRRRDDYDYFFRTHFFV
jgi:hypothetical protein